MKFLIVKNQLCAMSTRSKKTVEAFPLDVHLNPTPGVNMALFYKFEQAFSKVGTGSSGSNKWSLQAEFKLNSPKEKAVRDPRTRDRDELGKWDIVLKGDTLKHLHQLLYHGNENVSLEIGLYLTCKSNMDSMMVRKFHIKGLAPIMDADGKVDLSAYQVKNAEAPLVSPCKRNFLQSSWRVTVEVSGKDFLLSEDVLPNGSMVNINEKIFRDKSFCDFELVSADGTAVPCHKSFLGARSTVLSNMLQGDFKEARENKMTMTEMSTRAVNALLAYVYCNDVQEVLACCDVAFELLKVSHMYDIDKLWGVVISILEAKSDRWYSVEAALNLYDFVRNCDRQEERQKMMQKLITVLIQKRDQLPGNFLYLEMFPTGVSRDMFQSVLDHANSLEETARTPNLDYNIYLPDRVFGQGVPSPSSVISNPSIISSSPTRPDSPYPYWNRGRAFSPQHDADHDFEIFEYNHV